MTVIRAMMILDMSPTHLLSIPLLAAGSLVVVATLYLFLFVASSYVRGWCSPLNTLPGPRPTSLLLGNFGIVNEQEADRMMEKWVYEYGRAYVVRSLLGVCRILRVVNSH